MQVGSRSGSLQQAHTSRIRRRTPGSGKRTVGADPERIKAFGSRPADRFKNSPDAVKRLSRSAMGLPGPRTTEPVASRTSPQGLRTRASCRSESDRLRDDKIGQDHAISSAVMPRRLQRAFTSQPRLRPTLIRSKIKSHVQTVLTPHGKDLSDEGLGLARGATFRLDRRTAFGPPAFVAKPDDRRGGQSSPAWPARLRH